MPSESRSLHKRVAQLLREAIVFGNLKPGDHINESQVASQLGVSRGPLREAIRDLEQEGLVVSTPHKATVVQGISEAEVQNVLIPVRLVLEGFACSEVQPVLNSADFEHLEGLVERMRSSALVDIVEADLAFHEYLVVRSEQVHTHQVWRMILPRARAYFFRNGYLEDPSKFAEEHAELLRAIRTGTKDEMLASLRAHIEVPWLDGSSAE